VGVVVGYGSVGRKHAAEMAALFPSLAIADTKDAARRAAAEDHPGACVAGDLDGLDAAGLAWGAAVAVVATWGPTHAELFHALVDRGVRRILSEKPLAASVADACGMAARAAREGVRLEVHHYFRYAGMGESIRRLLAEHGLGEPVSLVVTGGAACGVTNGIHWLDLASELFGAEPRSVVADLRSRPINPRSPDLGFYGGTAVWDFGGDRSLTLSLSNDSSVAMEARLYMRDAVAELDENLRARLRRRPGDTGTDRPVTRTGAAQEVLFEGVLPGTRGYREGIRLALETVRSDSPPVCPAAVGAAAVSGCVGALVASREKRRIPLPIDPNGAWGREAWPIS
jgi:predicted dehydrogenase